MELRDRPDRDPGSDYILHEPGFSIIRDRIAAGDLVLDVGCGFGNVGQFLALSGAQIDGIEPDRDRAGVAADRLADVRTLTLDEAANFDSMQRTYDVVTILDVLEHFESPVRALTLASSFLKANGVLYLLVPNSAHWTFRQKILWGDWSYDDSGLFDRTHLRFFDLRSIRTTIGAAGLVETNVWYTSPSRSRATRLAVRVRPNLFALHFLFELRAGPTRDRRR